MSGKREYVVVVALGYVKKLIATKHCVLIRYLPLVILAAGTAERGGWLG